MEWKDEDERLLSLLESQERIGRARRELGAWCEHALAPLGQEPAAHHRLLIRELQAVAKGDNDRLMVFMPPGSAKALALDTPIPTPEGWKQIGDLRVGDRVFGDDGVPCDVTWVSPIWRGRPVYRVRTDCGDEVIADRDHEWHVQLCRKPRRSLKIDPRTDGRIASGGGRWARSVGLLRDDPASRFKLKATWQLAGGRVKRPLIERAKPLVLPHADLPLDPYVLGIWLGDGAKNGGRITCSLDDQAWLRPELARLGLQTTDNSVAINFHILGLRGVLVKLGVLGNKHIPLSYLRASESQRLALLQGLIDTDGTVSKDGAVSFCNTNRRLAEEVRELARTLGVKAGWIEGRATLKGKDCGPVYRVSLYHAQAARLPRKAALCRNQHRTPNTYIDVEEVGTADTVCIEVNSPTHLFLCGRSMTPTHNSTYASILFPAWFFAQDENLSMIGASHTSTLAEDFSRRIHGFIRDHSQTLGYHLTRESAELWTTSNGGRYRAAGIGGPIAGSRADLALIDDPVKSRADADSERKRQVTWDWFRADLLTRLRPGGRIVLIQTRWHQSDLAGRLLEAEAARWRVVKLPALAETDDALGRAPGEPLWPEWETGKMLADKRRTLGERDWSALFQQNPRPAEGSILRSTWWKPWTDPLPTPDMTLVSLDLAYTEKEQNDRSACTVWDVSAGDDYRSKAVMVHAWADRLEFPELVEKVVKTAKQAATKYVPLRVLIEAKGPGLSVIQEMRRRIPSLNIHSVIPKGDKVARAHAVTAMFEAGVVHALAVKDGTFEAFAQPVIDECAAFPVGTHDDMVDSVTMALRHLRDLGAELFAEDAGPVQPYEEPAALY